MDFVTIGIVIGFAIWMYWKMPKIPKVSQKPGEIDAPTCEDGAHLPVVFGTVCQKGANTTWWGGVETEAIDNGRTSYRLSMRMQLCHGPLDSILKILIGGKDAFAASGIGPVTANGHVNLKAWKILGTGSSDDVTGYVLCRMGYPNSILGNNAGVYSKASELNGETNGLGPGYFGIACVELERTMIGTSPYMTPWAFIIQRISKRNSITTYGYTDQWYLEKSYIPHGVTGETWWTISEGSSDTVPSGNMATWYQANIPSEWTPKWLMPFGTGSAPTGLPAITDGDVNYGWAAGKHLWAQTTVYTDPTDFKLLQKIYLFVYCENAAWVWIDDVYVGTTNATNEAVTGSSANFDVTDTLRAGGSHTIVIYCLDEDPAGTPDSTYVYARVVTSPVVDNNVDAATLFSYRDMNPAHIIRECLSDQVWGLGYLDADIDDVTFMAVADTLYQERFGISILWNKPGSILDFINEILRHINGVLYINRTTGKFEIGLIREGYDTDGLVVLDDASVVSIEDFSCRSVGELINQVSVSYTSSAMGDEATVTITEPGLVQSQGSIISQKIDYPGITTHDLASRVALRELKALSSPARSCTVIASRKAATLNPGDPFKLTRTEYGLTNTVMRVASIELGDGRTNRVRIKCVEDVFASNDDNVSAPPVDVWSDPVPVPVPVPDPIFVDTYNYKSTFYVAKIADPAVKQSVDAVFCRFPGASGGLLAELFNQRVDPGMWEEIRPGVWRAGSVGQAIPEYYTDGVTVFAGMRLLVAFVQQTEYPDADLEAEDKPRQGIYVLTDPGFSWDEDTRTYTSTYAQLERASDFLLPEHVSDGCIVQIANGTANGGKWARLTTTGAIVIGTTELAFERLDSYTTVRGDNLLTESQKDTWGDGSGDALNLSATVAEPGTWIAFPTFIGTPNAATYPAGRTRWKFRANFLSGDTTETSTIECQIVKYTSNEVFTVLAEAESDPIVGGDALWWGEYETHDDVDTDQSLAGGRLAVRYRLTTTSASQVVVQFRYGDMLYMTNVSTPLTLGDEGGFTHTPYGPVIELDANGILVIPDMDTCSGEVRVSGAEFKGIQITDALGQAFVGGDKLSIRLTTNCYIHHDETVAAGSAGLNVSASALLTGADADRDVGPRSQIILQYDDLEGQWEIVGQPTLMDKV